MQCRFAKKNRMPIQQKICRLKNIEWQLLVSYLINIEIYRLNRENVGRAIAPRF